MIITMNGVEYTTDVSEGITTVSWDTGRLVSSLSEAEALKELVLRPLKQQREAIFLKEGWRVHSANYPYNDQQEWIDYFTELRDLPSTYVQGENIVLPSKPRN